MLNKSWNGIKKILMAALGKAKANDQGCRKENIIPASIPDTEDTRARSNVKPYKVLHISDVHFGASFDDSVWEYVCALAKRERPDLIACTGDVVDHGGLFMLALARKELEALILSLKLKDHADVVLRCVPGNHDVGLWGNIKIPPFSTNFAAVFGAAPINLPSWIPAYTKYKARFFLYRWLCRFGYTIALYAIKWCSWLWRLFKGQERWRVDLTRKDDPKEVFLVHLDSNHTPWLATGNVDPREVTNLKAHMLNLRDENGARPFVPRIALVHHHPLPIPESSIQRGLTSFEPFLVLRNSGLVMRELNRCDVDLILHGHKHYAAFGRLGYAVDNDAEGEIAVLAAGSSGVTHSEIGRNSVNLVDIFETGRMSFTSIYFGSGGGAKVNELSTSKREVHGLGMHKARAHRRAAERQSQWIEKVNHAVVIDEAGVAVVKREVHGHVFCRSMVDERIPVFIDVSMGRVTHTTLQLTENSKRAGHTWADKPDAPQQKVRCGIHLGRRLVDGPSADYGYQYICFNTYAVTQWEVEAAHQRERDAVNNEHCPRSGELEYSSVLVRIPTRLLVFRLQFPNQDVQIEPFLQVMRWSTYPGTRLGNNDHFEANDKGEWLLEPELTQHEAGRLVQVSNNLWELRIEYPLVGHRYDIKWRVPAVNLDEEGGGEAQRRGKAVAYRDLLLNLTKNTKRCQRVQAWSSELEAELSRHFGAFLSCDRDIEVAVFAYNPQTHTLDKVFASQEGGCKLLKPLSVPLGEGVVGAAFKRSGFVVYADPDITGSRDDAAYLYEDTNGVWKKPEWSFVCAFPIFALGRIEELAYFDPKGWGPQSTVGVVTISSRAPDSGLVTLAKEWGLDEELDEEELTNEDPPRSGCPLVNRAESGAAASAPLRAETPLGATDGKSDADSPADSGSQEQDKPDKMEGDAPSARQIWLKAHIVLLSLVAADDPTGVALLQKH